MLSQVLLLCLITLVPALELRASIPYGILGNKSLGITPDLMPWFTIALICILCNILLGWILYFCIPLFFYFLDKIPLFNDRIEPLIARAQNKLAPYVEKYGAIGVALFIGIPLPGSGVYTGSLGAYMLGLSRRQFMYSCVIGVLIAGTLVTALTLLFQKGMLPLWADWIIKAH